MRESYHSAAQWLVLPRHKLGHNEYPPCPGQQRTHWVFSSAAASWDSCWVPAQIVFQMPRERSENKKGYEEAIRANFSAIRSRTQSELFITILWSRSRNENIHHVDSHHIFASSQVNCEYQKYLVDGLTVSTPPVSPVVDVDHFVLRDLLADTNLEYPPQLRPSQHLVSLKYFP